MSGLTEYETPSFLYSDPNIGNGQNGLCELTGLSQEEILEDPFGKIVAGIEGVPVKNIAALLSLSELKLLVLAMFWCNREMLPDLLAELFTQYPGIDVMTLALPRTITELYMELPDPLDEKIREVIQKRKE